MKVIVSVHDVSPYFLKEIEIILKTFEGINKSFLITPLWNGSNLFTREIVDLIKQEDLILHGLTHQASKNDPLGKLVSWSNNSCKEFYGLDAFETELRIRRAIVLFENSFYFKPTGFIPPMWYHNAHLMEVLTKLGFIYTETELEFIHLTTKKRHRSLPVCFDFGNNNFLNHVAVNGWKYILKHIKQPLLRLSIHPADIKNGFCMDILKLVYWLKEKGYDFITYKQLI